MALATCNSTEFSHTHTASYGKLVQNMQLLHQLHKDYSMLNMTMVTER